MRFDVTVDDTGFGVKPVQSTDEFAGQFAPCVQALDGFEHCRG